MSTALDIDIAALVGAMDAIPCESHGHNAVHNAHLHDGGPATTYARVACPHCPFSAVKAYCQSFTEYLQADGLILCNDCYGAFHAHDNTTILGPVGGTAC